MFMPTVSHDQVNCDCIRPSLNRINIVGLAMENG